MEKHLQNSEPFVIKYDKDTCGMNSALQCLLSLPNFLSTLNLPNPPNILRCFSKFLQNPHDMQDIKKCIESRNKNIFQNSFEFLKAFIDTIKKDSKKYPKDLFYGDISEINECQLCNTPSQSEHNFNLIELSFAESLRIICIPYKFDKSPELMSQIPYQREKYVFMYQKFDKFNIIDGKKISPKYPNIFAFELPKSKSENMIVIIQLYSLSDGSISLPFLCEVPLTPENNVLQEDISKRIQNLFKPRNLKINIHDEITQYKTYGQYKICLKSIQATVENNKICNERKPEEEEETCLTLKEMFDNYISMSPIKDDALCEYCNKESKPFFRKRLTKLPQILIFRIKKSEKRSDSIAVPEFICLDTGEYNKMEVIGNPSNYKEVDGFKLYELRAVSHHCYKPYRTLKTFSDVKRGSQWYNININDKKITKSTDYPLSEPSSTADLLFYEIVNNGMIQDDNIDGEEQKTTRKIIIKYIFKGQNKSSTFDITKIENTTDFIELLREKLQCNEIAGFKLKNVNYYHGDETQLNEVFPEAKRLIPTIEIILVKPVSKPSNVRDTPLGRPLMRPSPTKNPSTSGKNLSYAAIDNSASMIGCFKCGTRRSKAAVEAIERFLLAGQLYCNSDTFTYYEIFNPRVKKPVYNKDNFIEPSILPDILESLTESILKKSGFQNKRILLISDGVLSFDEDGDDKERLIETYKKIIDNQIVFDVIILRNLNTQIAKDLCAVSHISGGYYYFPENLRDLYSFIQYEKVVDIRKRDIHLFSSFNENIFKKISDNISTMSKIKAFRNFYQDMKLVSPFFELEIEDDINIEKQIYNCAYVQKNEEQTFSIYRVFKENEEIDKQRIVVFLKSKEVILQFYIFFTASYPNEAPWFKLISNVEMNNDKIPNYLFQVSEKEYTKKTKLLDLINELNKLLQSSEVEDDLKDVVSPINSFDQIELLFFTSYGAEPKNLDDYKD